MWFTSIQTQILGSLGEGAQGRVFKALRIDRKTGLSHTVAIKILHSETAVELWGKEFRSLQRVRSPYCVPVLSFERVTGRPALVLEYVEGLCLSEVARAKILDDTDITEVIAQIESGLLDLHAQQSYHGDLSPANVMLDVEGHVRLLDFGLANGTVLRGTPEFTAPERFAGIPAGLSGDLFALGRLDQFLRGQDLRTLKGHAEYLNLDPSARGQRNIPSQAFKRREIARKLEMFLEQRRIAAAIVTRSLIVPPPRQKTSPWHRVLTNTALILTCAFLGSTRASQIPPQNLTEKVRREISPETTGELNVRTHAWYRLELDGTPVGYAPLKLSVKTGRHVLRYTGLHARGQLQIKVSPDRAININDHNFSH